MGKNYMGRVPFQFRYHAHPAGKDTPNGVAALSAALWHSTHTGPENPNPPASIEHITERRT